MTHSLRGTLHQPFLWTSLTVVWLFAGMASTAQGDVLWYGGDAVATGFANNTRLSGGFFGNSVLDDFIVDTPGGWHVTGLFSNNVASPPTTTFTLATWSVRTDVSAGNFGEVVVEGVSPVTITPTGRSFRGDPEFTVAIAGLSFDLAPGLYFMSVSPIAPAQFYYVGNSTGLNAVGIPGPGSVLLEEHFLENGQPSDNIYDLGDIHPASLGVIGSANVPEPSTVVLVGIGLIGIAVKAHHSGKALLKCRHTSNVTLSLKCTSVPTEFAQRSSDSVTGRVSGYMGICVDWKPTAGSRSDSRNCGS
jgi:PEP-CTERM motif